VTEDEELAAQFETQRPYLHAIAFRMLGSHADADDAVQEAWLRLARTGGGDIEDLRGWLTTVTGRICLDTLRRRGARGEQPLELDIGTLPREAVGDSRIDPEQEALLAESVGLALYVVMDALTPAERVSFVLHDVFEVPFDAIAAILGRSTAATKMLASRARGRLRLGAPTADAHAAARDVIDAFFAAVGRDDDAELLALLAPEVELRARGPEGTAVIRGARGRGPGDDGGAPGRAGASGAREWRPGRPRHRGRAAVHGRSLHGRGRSECPRPVQLDGAPPGRFTVGGCRCGGRGGGGGAARQPGGRRGRGAARGR
jgi:RNA polymerase sigma factor (sigma-70 family)